MFLFQISKTSKPGNCFFYPHIQIHNQSNTNFQNILAYLQPRPHDFLSLVGAALIDRSIRYAKGKTCPGMQGWHILSLIRSKYSWF